MRGGRKLVDDPVVIHEDEADFRVPDGLEMHLVLDVAGFGIFRPQKLAARGKIVKERAHFDLRAWRVAGVLDGLDLSTVHDHFGAGQGARFPRGQAETRHAGDAGQGFSTESQCMDGGEVIARADFAGGVPFQAEQGIVAVHSTAVVDDANGGDASAADEHLNPARAGIDGVFHQLFDHAGWALHDLASGNLAGDLFGKESDAGHGEGIFDSRLRDFRLAAKRQFSPGRSQ